MAQNKISDLRDHLFEIIEMLKGDHDKTIDIENAKAIVDVAGKIIDSAKVEVEYLKLTGQHKSETEFLKPINEVKKLGVG